MTGVVICTDGSSPSNWARSDAHLGASRVHGRRPTVCGTRTMPERCRVAERASLARARRGRVLVAGLIASFGLAALGFIDRGAIAQHVVGQDRWRMAMDPTVLTVAQEKAKAAKPGSDFKECANGCPVMIVIPAGKFMMGSPESEPDRNASEGPQHEVAIARPFAVSKFEVTFDSGMLASPRRRARESRITGDAGRCP